MEKINNLIVGSFNKHNAMLEFKAYLMRQYIERMKISHTRQFLKYVRSKIKIMGKNNILVLNLNVVKCACLLIENLADVGLRFNQL